MQQSQSIIGSGGKSGGSSRVASEDANTLRSTSVAQVVDIISEGPIVGLVDGAQNIYFSDTQLQNSDGTYNFAKYDSNGNTQAYVSSVDWGQRTGLPDQDYLPGFVDAATTVVVNAEIKASIPIVRTYTGPVDAVCLTVSMPALTYQDASTGDLHGSSVSLRISRRKTGTSTWQDVRDVTITGKCVATYQFSARLELGGETDWDVKITRLTSDSTTSNLQNHTTWATTSLIIDGKFIYPNTAYVGLSADAEYFGSSIPTRAYKTKGLIIQVPSNYDPVARTYTGLWDGTFKTAWTNNPAWVLYDVLTNERYGLGRYMKAAQVDKWGLYTIAQYCDELVPDGFGGTEPRFTFNYQITSLEDAYKVVQSIASSFRGQTFWSSGQIFFFADMPVDPVKLVTPANIKDGLFTYEGTSYSSQHSVAMVTWFDPSDMCRQAIELIEYPDLIAKFGWRTTEIVAYGCTSRGQAHRLGKWALDTEKYAQETVNYEAGWDQIDMVPGDIIEVYDPDYANLRLSGRITNSTLNSIRIDSPVTIETGKIYTLNLMMPDSTIASRVLNNTVGQASVLTFDTSLPSLPVDGAVWGVAVSDLKPRQFRVLSIKESDDGYFIVSALFHDPTKYDRVEQNIKLEAPVYSRYVPTKPNPPLDLAIKEYVYRYNASLQSAATLTLTPPANSSMVQSYELQRRRANGNWEALGTIGSVNLDVLNCDAGSWTFRVRCIGYNGLISEWFSKDVTLYGLAAAPNDVSNFAMHALGDIATLSWDANTDLDLAYYHIKFSPITSGATWSAAVDLLPNVSGTSVQVPTMIGTYLIKAVDLSGTESDNAISVVTTVASLSGFNAVAAVSDWPNWNGTHSGTEVSSGLLKLSVGNTTGIYTYANTTDLGDIYTSRLSAFLDAYGEKLSDTWAAMGAWSTLGAWSDVSPSLWSVTVQLRWTDDDPSTTPTWSNWTDFVVGDYTARAYQFRLILTSSDANIIPVVADTTATIDMPDRRESVSCVVTPADGKIITFSPAFRGIPAVGITCQNQQTGDSFQYTAAPTAKGFAIQFLDKNGTAVSRTFDYIADGFGRAN